MTSTPTRTADEAPADPFVNAPGTYAGRISRLPRERLRLQRDDSRLVLAHVVVAFVALLLGGIAGLLQSLQHSGRVDMPSWLGYYQLLTVHGVLMALVFTTFFIVAFCYAGMAVTQGGELLSGARGLGWAGFGLMTVGTALAAAMILAGKASVLYTFYAPMAASPWFYVGLAAVVVGSWLSGAGLFLNYAMRRRETRTKVQPLFAFMAVATFVLWQICSLGVAAEVVLQLIPWSFGWTEGVDVLLSRTLFWYFGHPLVYFWLLPAYIAWYLVMPRLIGGDVFSDSLVRLAIILLIIFSMPVGVHHQLMEPGIDEGWKFYQVGLTLAVVIPSLMTAFALWGTMEQAGRRRGFGGLFGWLKGLPWSDARFLALFVGMASFIPGGAGGIINASYNLNQVVHNTMYITGHFHLTVATAVALTFIGTAYWLVPHATGRIITPRANRWMLAQVATWGVGMSIMSTAQHWVGLLGAPRRTMWIDYGDDPVAGEWGPYQFAMAVGGSVLFVSVLLAVGLVAYLMTRAPKAQDVPELAPARAGWGGGGEPAEFPLADPREDDPGSPPWLERWGLWIAIILALVASAYVVPISEILRSDVPGSPRIDSFSADEAPTVLPASPAPGEGAAAAEEGGLPEVSTEAPAGAAAGTNVGVELGEEAGGFYVTTSAPSVDAGTVTFGVENAGNIPHELVVMRTDTAPGELPVEGGVAVEEGVVARVPQLAPGSDTAYVTLELEEGSYVLLCNLPGHYAGGQYVGFEVDA